MRTMFILAACTMIGLATSSAQAQSTGLRVEATTGYDVLTSSDIYEGADDVVPDTLRGLRIGIAAGYDMALAPRVTIGVEAGLGTTVSGAVTSRYDGNTLSLDAGRDIDLSARIGVALLPGTLVFAKAGYANSRSTADLRELVGSDVDVTEYGSNGSGIRLGGGIEQALGGRLYAKAEYRWTRYGDDDIQYQSSTRRHQVLLGVGMRF